MRAMQTVPSLREGRVFGALKRSIGRANRSRFRVLHFSIQTDHVHLIVEADSTTAFEHGMRGLTILSALGINGAARRRGKVGERRFHAHALRRPTKVRRAIAYVLLNFRKHLKAGPGVDPRSSAVWFEDWVGRADPRHLPRLVAAPRTWLANIGWRRAGPPLRVDEMPGSSRRRR